MMRVLVLSWFASACAQSYPFSSRGGNPHTSGSTKYTAPTDFSAESALSSASVLWNNSLDEQVRHSPLIDNDKNIYIMTGTRIRKLDSDGKILWNFLVPEEEGMMSTSPALYDGALYAMAQQLHPIVLTVYSFDMETGKQRWKMAYKRNKGQDSQGILAYNNTVLLPTKINVLDGSDSVSALRTSDGTMLWEYVTDDVMWNFKPSTPGDGSIIFSSSCGAVHRIDWNGKLMWKKPALSKNLQGGGFCSMGGGSVGPNGVFYAQHGDAGSADNLGRIFGGRAHINAYRISDGQHLWSKSFNEFGGQYPAVGYLGKDGPLAVVAPIGSSLTFTAGEYVSGGPLGSNQSNWLVNAVVAMDANTGDMLWRFEEKRWPYAAAAGDFGPARSRRIEKRKVDKRQEVICLPDPQGIPLISGDGHVYMSSSHNGELHAMKDVDGDGYISSAEVSTLPTKVGFLNSPSLAPGMLVVAPCWGSVYIFKEKEGTQTATVGDTSAAKVLV